jgi:hypothetical protein
LQQLQNSGASQYVGQKKYTQLQTCTHQPAHFTAFNASVYVLQQKLTAVKLAFKAQLHLRPQNSVPLPYRDQLVTAVSEKSFGLL